MTQPDWAALPSDLIEHISDLLIADDTTDFIRLRAVCHLWRSSTQKTKSRVDCLYPRNWIVLSGPRGNATQQWRLYNTSTHKSFSFDLTPYLEGSTLFRAFACAFLLKNYSTQGIALLNPLMRSVTQLPRKIESKYANAPSEITGICYFADWYITRSGTIVFGFPNFKPLAWTRPGDKTWVYEEFEVKERSVLFYEDQLFALVRGKGLVVINFANEIPQPQEDVIPLCNLPDLSCCCALYLVDCGGDILLVCCMPVVNDGEFFGQSLEVYRLDLKRKTYNHTRDLRNHTLFLGERGALSLSCKNLFLIEANSIYCFMDDETTYYTLNTDNVWSSKPHLSTYNLVKELSTYCEGLYA